LFVLILLLTAFCGPVLGKKKMSLKLPKMEGFKKNDLEIDQLNNKDIA
jgi:hypothetical protein